jgi:hypothetical protein
VIRTLFSLLERANFSHQVSLSKEPNGVRASLPTPEDGNRSSLQTIVFCSYLEFQMMDKAHKPNDSECYAVLSEHFRFSLYFYVLYLMSV